MGAKPLSIVRRMRGSSASGGAPAASMRSAAAPCRVDEERGRDGRGRVVGGTLFVVQLERLEPEQARQREAGLA